MAQPPPQSINHKQLRTGAAPGFDEAGSDVRAAVRRAAAELRELGGWSTGEEVDEAFVEWFLPKKDEMIDLIGQFAEVYEDVGDGLRAVSHNVATVDWGLADDLKIEDLPLYTWPPKEGS